MSDKTKIERFRKLMLKDWDVNLDHLSDAQVNIVTASMRVAVENQRKQLAEAEKLKNNLGEVGTMLQWLQQKTTEKVTEMVERAAQPKNRKERRAASKKVVDFKNKRYLN